MGIVCEVYIAVGLYLAEQLVEGTTGRSVPLRPQNAEASRFRKNTYFTLVKKAKE